MHESTQTGSPHAGPAPPRLPVAIPVTVPVLPHASAPILALEPQPAPFNWETSQISFPAFKWLNAFKEVVADHIRMPTGRAVGEAGNQHPKFKVLNTPLVLIENRCLEAGLTQVGRRQKVGKEVRTTWKSDGPMTAYRFCDLKSELKKWGVGSALLVMNKKRPGRWEGPEGDKLVLAIPPITVVHHETPWGDFVKVNFYLGIFNSSNRFTLPSTANMIYKGDVKATEDIFIQMSIQVLGEMLMARMPLTAAFKALLPREYASDAGELTEEEEEEEEAEAEVESEEEEDSGEDA